ncbi:hypothetical protein D9615_009690 [Tricholomella constricta]|uniref:Integrase catalytic domain-containing protein n=1 Tax=Tricholomella constricta TaxID=117010 RepID=A0A8H5GUR8_9AGAR|nr:hypothetical protein D9615_009690 [Tricholomella constricta]
MGLHQITAPYAHSQNGKAERYIRTLEETAQTLLAESGLPPSFFGDAILTARYLRNRLPTSTLPADSTPFSIMENSKPDLSHLRVWGCQCFVLIPSEIRVKGGPKRFEGIFVGYEDHRVGWKVRDLNGRYHFSRDIVFNENVRDAIAASTRSPAYHHLHTTTNTPPGPILTAQGRACHQAACSSSPASSTAPPPLDTPPGPPPTQIKHKHAVGRRARHPWRLQTPHCLSTLHWPPTTNHHLHPHPPHSRARARPSAACSLFPVPSSTWPPLDTPPASHHPPPSTPFLPRPLQTSPEHDLGSALVVNLTRPWLPTTYHHHQHPFPPPRTLLHPSRARAHRDMLVVKRPTAT